MAIVSGSLMVETITDNAGLYAIWPRVRAGIEAMKKRSEGIFYMPEDVYFEIRQGRATLIVATDVKTGGYQGFVVIKDHPYPDGKGMFIWIMHHDGNIKSYVSDFMDALHIIGKSCGIVRYCTSAARPGWDRHAAKKGFKKIGSINHYEFSE